MKDLQILCHFMMQFLTNYQKPAVKHYIAKAKNTKGRVYFMYVHKDSVHKFVLEATVLRIQDQDARQTLLKETLCQDHHQAFHLHLDC